MKKTHIIIGSSAAGLSCATMLCSLDQESDVIVISDESELPYNKCFLADYVGGVKQEAALYTRSETFFKEQRIELMLGVRVVNIDKNNKEIVLHNNHNISYENLFLGMGASPHVPLHDVRKHNGVFAFHTLRNVQAMMLFIVQHNVKKAVIIGAGLSGLECADALLKRGITSQLVEAQDRLLQTQLTYEGAQFIERRMELLGISLHTNSQLVHVEIDDDRVSAVHLSDGRVLTTDMVIFTAGLRPNNDIAQQTQLAMQNGYVMVNDYMQTSDPSIFAGGDLVVVKDQLSDQLVPSRRWGDACLQGKYGAYAMAGKPKTYPGIVALTSSHFFGLPYMAGGLLRSSSENVITSLTDHSYESVLVEENQLKGFVVIGENEKAVLFKRALLVGGVYEKI